MIILSALIPAGYALLDIERTFAFIDPAFAISDLSFAQSIKRVSTARMVQLKNANTRTVQLISFNTEPLCA